MSLLTEVLKVSKQRNKETNKVVPDSNVHGAKMGPAWGRQDPGAPHVGPMNLPICGIIQRD